MRTALLSWNTIVANDTKATRRNENKNTEIPTGAFTTKLAEYTLMIYHETGVAIINASKNVAIYLRPKRRYKSNVRRLSPKASRGDRSILLVPFGRAHQVCQFVHALAGVAFHAVLPVHIA